MTKRQELQAKINEIAPTFRAKTGEIKMSPCRGSWRGCSDVWIQFDNGIELPLCSRRTQTIKTLTNQIIAVDDLTGCYTPAFVIKAKEKALVDLMELEKADAAIARAKGLEPYKILMVEFCDGFTARESSHLSWYFVTIDVGGKIHPHLETGLSYGIKSGTLLEDKLNDHYKYAAGGLHESEVDYVFGGVGFSTKSGMYTIDPTEEVIKRAEMAMAAREK